MYFPCDILFIASPFFLSLSLSVCVCVCVHLSFTICARHSNIWCKIFAWNSYNFSVKPSHFRNICSVFFCYFFLLLLLISSSFSLLATSTHVVCTYNIFRTIYFRKFSFLSNYNRNSEWQAKKNTSAFNWNWNQVTMCYSVFSAHNSVINFNIGHFKYIN